MSDAVAVFDVGKSSAKLALVDGATGAVTAAFQAKGFTIGALGRAIEEAVAGDFDGPQSIAAE